MQTQSGIPDLSGGRRGNHLEAALKDSCIRMTRSLDDGVPGPLRSALYALRRREPRKLHLLGSYPRAAIICAQHRAPWDDVVAPMRELEAFLRVAYYSEALPSVAEINNRETRAEGRLNPLQLHLAERITRHVVTEAREAARLHRDELEVMIAVLDQHYYDVPALRRTA